MSINVDTLPEISTDNENELLTDRKKKHYHDAGAVRGYQPDSEDEENDESQQKSSTNTKSSSYAPPYKESFAVALSSDHQPCVNLPRDHLPFLLTQSVVDVLVTKPPHRRPLIALPASATVEQALQTLRDHDLLALPIMCSNQSSLPPSSSFSSLSAKISEIDASSSSTSSLADSSSSHASSSSSSSSFSSSSFLPNSSSDASVEKPVLSTRDQFEGIVNLYDLCIPLLFHKVFDELIQESGDESDWQSLNNAALPEWGNCVGALLGISAESERPIWMSATNTVNDLVALFSRGIHRCLVDDPTQVLHPPHTDSSSSSSSSSPHLSHEGDKSEPSARPDISGMRPRSASQLASTLSLSAPDVELVSQTDLLRWIKKNVQQLTPLMNLTLEQAGLVRMNGNNIIDSNKPAAPTSFSSSSTKSPTNVVNVSDDADNCSSIHSPPSRVEYRVRKRLKSLISVTGSTLAILAFRHMAQWSQGECISVPVLNEAGRVTDTLTIGDLRFVTPDCLNLLSLPVNQFLDTIRSKRSHIKSALTCGSNTTIAQLVDMLADDGFHVCSHGHGVWVTDDQGVAITAVTITDIIALLCQHEHHAC